MKTRWIVILCWLCLAVAGRSASADTWALLVGVSKYQNPDITPLRYPAADAESIQEMLKKYGNLPADHVKLLTDSEATRANIMAGVQDYLAKNVKAGDQIILFLAGHGVTKGVGAEAKSYFLSTDVRGVGAAALEASAISIKELTAEMGKLPAGQFTIFMDACREDPTPGRGVKGNPNTDVLTRSALVVPKGINQKSVTFFACSVGQRAYEDPQYGHGVFTYYILQAIQSEKSDVPARPDGAIDMGKLSNYVQKNVIQWAKQKSQNGNFDIDQTPESDAVNSPLTLMKVSRSAFETSLVEPVFPPKVEVRTVPENAQVFVNGVRSSPGPVVSLELKPDENSTIRVEAPGYVPQERMVRGSHGYREQVSMMLTPTMVKAAVGGVPNKTDDFFRRALEAENNDQIEAAAAGYQAVLDADPKYAPAYEHLAAVQVRQKQYLDSITTLIHLNTQTEPTAHSYSLLARAYASYAAKNPSGKSESSGKNDRDKPKKGGGRVKIPGGTDLPFVQPGSRIAAEDYHTPKDMKEAGMLAMKAADQAVQLDANLAEAQIARGFALIASDDKGRNRQESLAAFGKAIFLSDSKDATASYGLGYALRYFALSQKNKDAQKEDLNRAVTNLKAALKIRPNYYEAHRELGHCYVLLENTPEAKREYEEAAANRGGTEDNDDVAGVNLAMSALWKQEGKDKESKGFMEDAKEDPNVDLKRAAGRLLQDGLGGNIPRNFGDAFGKIVPGLKLPGGLSIPGGIKLPGGIRFP